MSSDEVMVTPRTEITVTISEAGHAVIETHEPDPRLVVGKVVIPPEWVGRPISKAEIMQYIEEGLSQGLAERLLFPQGMGKANLDSGPALEEIDQDLDRLAKSMAQGSGMKESEKLKVHVTGYVGKPPKDK